MFQITRKRCIGPFSKTSESVINAERVLREGEFGGGGEGGVLDQGGKVREGMIWR